VNARVDGRNVSRGASTIGNPPLQVETVKNNIRREDWIVANDNIKLYNVEIGVNKRKRRSYYRENGCIRFDFFLCSGFLLRFAQPKDFLSEFSVVNIDGKALTALSFIRSLDLRRAVIPMAEYY